MNRPPYLEALEIREVPSDSHESYVPTGVAMGVDASV